MGKAPDIRVFEHQRLLWKDAALNDGHVRRLIAWNEANGGKYFRVGLKSFIFTQYVGVIQVGDRVIEVLPKADRKEGDDKRVKDRWQNALLTMLHTVHDIPLTSTTETDLQKRTHSILDFFFGLFVSDVEDLVHRGLVKRYRRTKGNHTALKGRLDFPRHIQQNLIHQERFFVEHQVYDTDHLLHALFKEALGVVSVLSRSNAIGSRAKGLDWAFEHVTDRVFTPYNLERIVLDRKTAPYSRAVQLAKMIVLNHAPDLKGGRMPLIGLLFDMNRLYEEYVFRILKRAARSDEFRALHLRVLNQRSTKFWNKKRIRPDLVLEHGLGEDVVRTIVDTKWKVPPNGKPSDQDLKQMYAYNIQVVSKRSVLLYPFVQGCRGVSGEYAATRLLMKGWDHGCEMQYAKLFDDTGGPRMGAAGELLRKLI